ncbi:MAG: baculoviral IAP repeat-containing protein [Candidatus Endonucleobacter sp. (ex Gigantidas childressi)]|nr:baculoviral IAP repeat-containing protein [Candidatus Endonucleobacter sp. (ex Gigantidas childressi)]
MNNITHIGKSPATAILAAETANKNEKVSITFRNAFNRSVKTAKVASSLFKGYNSQMREKTFANCNNLFTINNISHKSLAESGFIYTGIRDKVQCVFCGGVLSEFKKGDTARGDHAQQFVECPLVTTQLPGDFELDPKDDATFDMRPFENMVASRATTSGANRAHDENVSSEHPPKKVAHYAEVASSGAMKRTHSAIDTLSEHPPEKSACYSMPMEKSENSVGTTELFNTSDLWKDARGFLQTNRPSLIRNIDRSTLNSFLDLLVSGNGGLRNSTDRSEITPDMSDNIMCALKSGVSNGVRGLLDLCGTRAGAGVYLTTLISQSGCLPDNQKYPDFVKTFVDSSRGLYKK